MKFRVAASILLILLAAAVTAVGVYIITDVSPEEPVATPQLPVPVEVAPVVQDRFLHELEALGTIEAVREGAVSPAISGPIISIPGDIELGSVVQAGQLLARVDPRDFELSVAKREAAVERAEANVQRTVVDIQRERRLSELNQEQQRLARSEFERLTKLRQQNLVSSQEAERQEMALRRIEEELEGAQSGIRLAQAQHAVAKAELATALADLEQARENLRDTEVRAPFAGVIAEKSVTLGERVVPGTVLFRLADVSTVKLEVRIPGVDVHQLDAGIETTVAVPGLDQEFEGRVAHIGPRADAATRSFPVEILIPNSPSQKLLPGMFARALIPVAEYPAAILIPRETVVFDDGEPAVFVVDAERNVALRRGVTIERRFGTRYMIARGLEAGELLVSAGQRLLVDGARVRIVARRELTFNLSPEPNPTVEGRAPGRDS